MINEIKTFTQLHSLFCFMEITRTHLGDGEGEEPSVEYLKKIVNSNNIVQFNSQYFSLVTEAFGRNENMSELKR